MSFNTEFFLRIILYMLVERLPSLLFSCERLVLFVMPVHCIFSLLVFLLDDGVWYHWYYFCYWCSKKPHLLHPTRWCLHCYNCESFELIQSYKLNDCFVSFYEVVIKYSHLANDIVYVGPFEAADSLHHALFSIPQIYFKEICNFREKNSVSDTIYFDLLTLQNRISCVTDIPCFCVTSLCIELFQCNMFLLVRHCIGDVLHGVQCDIMKLFFNKIITIPPVTDFFYECRSLWQGCDSNIYFHSTGKW